MLRDKMSELLTSTLLDLPPSSVSTIVKKVQTLPPPYFVDVINGQPLFYLFIIT